MRNNQIQSMTGYARYDFTIEGGNYQWEITSLNRKTLEIFLHIPHELSFLDLEIRKEIQKKIKRGHVTIRLHRENQGGMRPSLPTEAVLKALYDEYTTRSSQLGLPNDATIAILIDLSHKLRLESQFLSKIHQDLLLDAFSKALQELVSMREKEAEALLKDINARFEKILEVLGGIEHQTQQAPKKYSLKLIERIAEMDLDIQIDQERLIKEIALFADKIDITEEIVRLRSHLSHVNELCLSGECFGRTLDFLLQEMFREVNTIASKSQDAHISQQVVLIKSEIEKIREQVSNLE